MMSFFRFVNKRTIYRLVKISLAHAHVTDFPVVSVHLDELSSAYLYLLLRICCTQYTVIDFTSGQVAHGQ
jgi:hypothetical protein